MAQIIPVKTVPIEDPGLFDTPLLAAIVHVASAIAHGLDVAGLENEMVPPVSALAWDRLALTEDQTDALFAQVEVAFRDACQILLA